MWDREGIGGQAIGRETRDTRYGRDAGEKRFALPARARALARARARAAARPRAMLPRPRYHKRTTTGTMALQLYGSRVQRCSYRFAPISAVRDATKPQSPKPQTHRLTEDSASRIKSLFLCVLRSHTGSCDADLGREVASCWLLNFRFMVLSNNSLQIRAIVT